MALLQIANLAKTYYMSDDLSADVLKGIDATFEKGEMVALLGESGCGKSTLLNILGGLDSEFVGSVIYNGEFMKDFSDEQMDDYRKSKVGIIFQGFNLIPHLSVTENVMLPMQMANWDNEERKVRAKKLLKAVGLNKHTSKLPNQLSGGQKQRVAIARALANNPDVILADEPTGNLDKESAAAVIKILREISESGKLVIIVTHSEAVANNCTRVITMDDGKFSSSKNNVVEIDRRQKQERRAEFQKRAKEQEKNADTAELSPEEQEAEEMRLLKESENVSAHATQNISKRELFRFAAANLWHQRSRSLFVSFGTSVGIIAMILMLALSVGLRGYVNAQVTNDESLLQINVIKDASNGGKSGDKNYFLTEDIEFLEGLDIKRLETSTTLNLAATYSYQNRDSQAVAGDILTLSSAHESYTPDLVYPDSLEDGIAAGQILISKSMANKLLESDTAVGSVDYSWLNKTAITISMSDSDVSQTFTIVGVIESSDELSGFAFCVVTKDDMKILTDTDEPPVTNVYVFAKEAGSIESLMDELYMYSYNAYRVDTAIESILYYIDLGTGVLIAVCAISLIVSAFMIYIVMNISITERTKEIGILRAIGARQKDVRNIFVFESSLLGAAAGIIAAVICAVISIAANLVISVELGMSIISGNPLIYIAGIAVSVLVSLFSGFSPAKRAGEADPVESLRRE